MTGRGLGLGHTSLACGHGVGSLTLSAAGQGALSRPGWRLESGERLNDLEAFVFELALVRLVFYVCV